MKTIQLNDGLLWHDTHEATGLTIGAAAVWHDLINSGQICFNHPAGHAVVKLRIHKAMGFFRIQKDGQLLSEFLVVPRHHNGQSEWHRFQRHFKIQVRKGRITGQPDGLQHPGPGPWTAVMLYTSMLDLPLAEVVCLEAARSALALAFATSDLPPGPLRKHRKTKSHPNQSSCQWR